MFEKLLALVPYNPGLVHQLAFYSKRMREEAAIRRVGMLFMVLAFVVQFLAVLNPPASAVTNGSNDLINGGFTTIEQAHQDCENDTQGYQRILHYYGISCDQLVQGKAINVTITSDGQQYKSAGRNLSDAKDTPVNIPGGGDVIYWRDLSAAFGAGVKYDTYRVQNQDGKYFYIIKACGNLVSVGYPTPSPLKVVTEQPGTPNLPPAPAPAPKPTPAPAPSPTPQAIPPATITSTCTSTTAFNYGSDSSGHFTRTRVTTSGTNPQLNDEIVGYGIGQNKTFSYLATGTTVTVTSREETDTANNGSWAITRAPTTQTFTCGQTPIQTCPFNQALSINDSQCFPPCQYDTTKPADANCKPCPQSSTPNDNVACAVLSKTASNVTTGLANADGSTANAGDVILYTISAQNAGKGTIKGYSFQENLNDVLDYADVVDLHGGTIDSNGIVSWPTEEIAAGATASHQITVKVKNPIPQTPVSSSDPTHFDLNMNNVYGNAINIKLPASVPKAVEMTAASLPNTGPGTTLFIGALVVMIGGYFYARSRLLARESAIAVKETIA